MWRKGIITVAALVLFAVAFGVCLFSGAFSPRAPVAWGQIHVGMSRAEVLTLLGTPQQSGWPEKIAETWQLNGIVE